MARASLFVVMLVATLVGVCMYMVDVCIRPALALGVRVTALLASNRRGFIATEAVVPGILTIVIVTRIPQVTTVVAEQLSI